MVWWSVNMRHWMMWWSVNMKYWMMWWSANKKHWMTSWSVNDGAVGNSLGSLRNSIAGLSRSFERKASGKCSLSLAPDRNSGPLDINYKLCDSRPTRASSDCCVQSCLCFEAPSVWAGLLSCQASWDVSGSPEQWFNKLHLALWQRSQMKCGINRDNAFASCILHCVCVAWV